MKSPLKIILSIRPIRQLICLKFILFFSPLLLNFQLFLTLFHLYFFKRQTLFHLLNSSLQPFLWKKKKNRKPIWMNILNSTSWWCSRSGRWLHWLGRRHYLYFGGTGCREEVPFPPLILLSRLWKIFWNARAWLLLPHSWFWTHLFFR